MSPTVPTIRPNLKTVIPGLCVWLVASLLLLVLDGWLGVGSMALVLVLAAATAAIWLPRWLSLATCLLAVLAFNYRFVTPRFTLSVNLASDVLLLVTLLLVSALVSMLVTRQRDLLDRERDHLARQAQLRVLGDALRETDDPRSCGPHLQAALVQATGGPVLVCLPGPPGDTDPANQVTFLGAAEPAEIEAIEHAWRAGQAMGPGTGRYEHLDRCHLPMRGRTASQGAVMVLPPVGLNPPQVLQHVQAMCDQMGVALERAAAVRQAAQARESARTQALRSTLLSAIAHDHRTPLASILGAAQSLLEQRDRLTVDQQHRLAATIVDEATQLVRITDNTLQLARLDMPGLVMHTDWESIEEIVGTVLARVRARHPDRTVRASVEPAMPLLRCDPVLMVQLLENLIDNAWRHGGSDQVVEVTVQRQGDEGVLTVADRGPGVQASVRERIFEPFERAMPAAGRGAGLGLALCQAVARVHGARLGCRERPGGGACFDYTWTLEAQAPRPPEEAEA